jgi:hypothetical protein
MKGKTDMGDKGKRDKGKREKQKKALLTPKEKRKLKREKKNAKLQKRTILKSTPNTKKAPDTFVIVLGKTKKKRDGDIHPSRFFVVVPPEIIQCR